VLPSWLRRVPVALAVAIATAAPASGGTATAADPAGTEGDLPAIILRKVLPPTPVETAGSGEAPTVDVRIRVGADGRVAGIEILRIRPSGVHDAAFCEAVETALPAWRFAPAIVDGEPGEATFDWSLEFRPLEAGATPLPGAVGDIPLFGGPWAGADRAVEALEALLGDRRPERERLLRIYTLPVEQQRRHLERLVTWAEKPLVAHERRVADSALFRVVTDHPDEEFARVVAHNLEATFSILAEHLGGDVPLQPYVFKVLVYAYRSRAGYLEFIHSVDGIEETSGFFCPPGLIAFHTEVATSEDLLSLLIHEAVHAFVFRALLPPGHALPRWLDEGFADYVGNSAVRKGRLELGVHRRSRFYRLPMEIVRGKTVQQLEVEELRREIRRGEALSVADVVNADRSVFYGSGMPRFYAQSWMLVHFLRHGGENWAEDRFPGLLLYALEGYPLDEVLRTVYGLDAEEMESRYREHVKGF